MKASHPTQIINLKNLDVNRLDLLCSIVTKIMTFIRLSHKFRLEKKKFLQRQKQSLPLQEAKVL